MKLVLFAPGSDHRPVSSPLPLKPQVPLVFIFIVFVCVVCGAAVELRASSMSGRCSTNDLYSQPFLLWNCTVTCSYLITPPLPHTSKSFLKLHTTRSECRLNAGAVLTLLTLCIWVFCLHVGPCLWRKLNHLELQSWSFIWVLGFNPKSSARAVSVLRV